MDTQTPQPNTPEIKTIPIHKDSFFHRHLVAEIIGILLVAATVGTIYYIFAGVQQVDITPVTHKADTTADWKTYINSQYGFSFKYPSDWKISCESSSIVLFNGICDSDASFTMSIDVSAGNNVVADSKSESITNKKEVQISGIDAERYQSSINDQNGFTSPNDNVYFYYNDNTYRMNFVEMSQTDTETFNQMLSSFNFLNPIGVVIYFKANTPEADMLSFEHTLQSQTWTQLAEYQSADEGLDKFKTEHANDPLLIQTINEFPPSENPLPPAITIRLTDPEQKQNAIDFIKSQNIYSSIYSIR